MKHILFITTVASPYRIQFFDELGKYTDLTVLFSESNQAQTHRSKDWFVESQGQFHQVLLGKKVLEIRGEQLRLEVLKWVKKPWDAIIINGYSSPTLILAMAWLRTHRIPYYLEVDGGLIRQDSKAAFCLKRKLVSSASGWFSSGSHTTDYLVHYGADREKVIEYPFSSLWTRDLLTEVPNREEKQTLRRELSMEEEYVLLSVGQFIHRKGYDVLMKAAAQLPKNVGIYIVGGMPTEEYEKMHRDLNLTNVHFSGFQKKESLSRFYRAADLFVLPTREDIWGLVVAEAMAYGLPVISTDRCVAGLELVQNGKNGYIVPVEDHKALAEKIQTALDGELSAMAEAALEAVQPYTIENMAKVHAQVFS